MIIPFKYLLYLSSTAILKCMQCNELKGLFVVGGLLVVKGEIREGNTLPVGSAGRGRHGQPWLFGGGDGRDSTGGEGMKGEQSRERS